MGIRFKKNPSRHKTPDLTGPLHTTLCLREARERGRREIQPHISAESAGPTQPRRNPRRRESLAIFLQRQAEAEVQSQAKVPAKLDQSHRRVTRTANLSTQMAVLLIAGAHQLACVRPEGKSACGFSQQRHSRAPSSHLQYLGYDVLTSIEL